MLTGIDHVQIAVPRALEAACLAFYRDALSLPEIEKPAELRARGGAWFQIGSLQLHIGVEDQASPPSKRHVCFLTQHLADLRRRLDTRGFPTEDGTAVEGLDRFFVRDPAGNRIEITAQ